MKIVELNHVTLDLPVYGTSTRSLKKQFVRFSTGGMIHQADNTIMVVRALNNLSLSFDSGETIGLIGRNGAGKSSFLKMLAGVYSPTNGKITINGKVSALLDIGLGMDPESTGYENIQLCGIIRGLTHRQITRKTQEIADFSELGNYLSMPIRTYSDGMRLRLAFSLATSIQPQILVLDEVLGVGDSGFIHKAQKRMENLIQKSELAVIATHSKDLIRQLCHKVLWLDKGNILYYGDVNEGLERYNQNVQEELQV